MEEPPVEEDDDNDDDDTVNDDAVEDDDDDDDEEEDDDNKEDDAVKVDDDDDAVEVDNTAQVHFLYSWSGQPRDDDEWELHNRQWDEIMGREVAEEDDDGDKEEDAVDDDDDDDAVEVDDTARVLVEQYYGVVSSYSQSDVALIDEDGEVFYDAPTFASKYHGVSL